MLKMISNILTIILAINAFYRVSGQATCSCACSTWMNRDVPSGVGDYEVTDATTDPTKPCPTNYYVQARVVGSSLIYNSAEEVNTKLGQKVNFVVNSNSQYGVGVYCSNAANTQPCLDYEVRFCCASDACSCGCSTWMNRDLPGGVGDYEVTDAATDPAKPCPKNYYVQTRVVGTTAIFNSPQEVSAKLGQNVSFVVNAYSTYGVGMYCPNVANSAICLNYETRFCCACAN